jgi:carboxylate-amine ligase
VILADGDVCRPDEEIDDVLLAENHRRAASYGLAGTLFDHRTSSEQPVPALLGALMRHARPALEASGDIDFAVSHLRRLLRHGNGAYRQCAVYGQKHSLPAVVDLLAHETATSLA